MVGFSRVILKISPHGRRKTVFDSPVAVAAQSNLLPALGLEGARALGAAWCFAAPETQAIRQPGSKETCPGITAWQPVFSGSELKNFRERCLFCRIC